MVHKILFWSGFGMYSLSSTISNVKYWPKQTGVAVRLWQLGIEMRPFFNRESLWAYPVFAGAGAGFGYWLDGVDKRQIAVLQEKKLSLLEKRRRRLEREGLNGSAATAGSSPAQETWSRRIYDKGLRTWLSTFAPRLPAFTVHMQVGFALYIIKLVVGFERDIV